MDHDCLPPPVPRSLPADALGRIGTVCLRVGTGIEHIVSSPTCLAVACSDLRGFVSFFDLATGQCSGRIQHMGKLSQPAYCAHGKLLSCINVTEVQLFDACSGEPVRRLERCGCWLSHLRSSPVGPLLAATAMREGRVFIWDSNEGVLIDRLEIDRPHSLAFSHDGTRLCVGTFDGRVSLWEIDRGQRIWDYQFYDVRVHSVAFAPYDVSICSFGRDGRILLIDAADGRVLHRVHGQPGEQGQVTTGVSNNEFAICAGADNVEIRSLEAGQKIAELSADGSALSSVCIGANDRLFVAGGADGVIHIWDGVHKKRLFEDGQHRVKSVKVSVDGASVFSGGDERLVYMWNRVTGKKEKCFAGLSQGASAVALGESGSKVAGASWSGEVCVWDVSGAQQVCGYSHSSGALCVTLSPSEKTVVSGGFDRVIRVWDVRQNREIRTITGHSGFVLAVAIAGDDEFIVSTGSDDDESIRVWEKKTGRQVARRRLEKVTRTIALANDGDVLVSGGEDCLVRLWTMPDLKPIKKLKKRGEPIVSIDVSSNGRWIASCGGEGSVCLWDVATGDLLREFNGHFGAVNSVAFSPSGKELVSGSDDTTILIWDCSRCP